MVVYGSKAKLLAKETQVDKCTHCGELNSVEIQVFQKYAHVFWIPFFPTGKTGGSQCAHCKQVLTVKQMPDSLRQSYEVLKKNTRTPIWTFAGLTIVVVLIALAIISDKQNDAQNAKLILDPKPGDVYEVKNANDNYTLYKVSKVVGDTVFILQNEYEVTAKSGLRKLRDKPFVNEPDEFLKSELKAKFDNGEIVDINR
jgi:hypothetical protein